MKNSFFSPNIEQIINGGNLQRATKELNFKILKRLSGNKVKKDTSGSSIENKSLAVKVKYIKKSKDLAN